MNLLLKSFLALAISFPVFSFASDRNLSADELDEMRAMLNTSSAGMGQPTRGECINGYGQEATAIIKPKDILERARYQPNEDGYLVFDLPEGYVTDLGVRVNLKSEATIYQEGKKELELIHMVQRKDIINIRVISYVSMNSGRKCVETKFTIPLNTNKN